LLKGTNLNEHREALARANADIATVPTHVRVLTISLERSTQNRGDIRGYGCLAGAQKERAQLREPP